jgi:threonine synthase
VNRAWRITDREAFTTARELLKTEGILAGSSSGTLLAAALKYCQAQTTPKRVVTFACDSGNKYRRCSTTTGCDSRGSSRVLRPAISPTTSPCATMKAPPSPRPGRHAFHRPGAHASV